MIVKHSQTRDGFALKQQTLHASLTDPIMGSMTFLNEIIDEFPEAISFAPGAVYPGFFDELDIKVYIDRYTEYLVDKRGMSRAQIARQLYQYGPSQGCINELIAEALRIDEDIHVDPSAIVVTAGCQEAMILALRLLNASAADLLAVVNPSYAGIAGAARFLDMNMIPIDDTGSGIDLAQLRLACHTARARGQRVRALYVAPDFSNPSGTLLDLDTRCHLIAMAEEEDFLILEDNAYGFTATPGSELPTLKSLDHKRRVIYLASCSKICMPGARVGFMVADQLVERDQGQFTQLANEAATLKSMLTVNTSPICQAIVGGMLLCNDGSLRQLGAKKSFHYRQNLAFLLEALDRHIGTTEAQLRGLTWNQPNGGFFVRMTLPVRVDVALLKRSAEHFGVLWTPMSYFHLNDKGDHQLRLSCSYLSKEQIDEGVRRLSNFLRDPSVCGKAQSAP